MCFGHFLTFLLWFCGCAETRTQLESDAQRFGKISFLLFFWSTKMQTLMTNLQLFFNILRNLRGRIKRRGFMVSDPRWLKDGGEGGIEKPPVSSRFFKKKLDNKETESRFGLFHFSSGLVSHLRGESCIITHHSYCLCAQGS